MSSTDTKNLLFVFDKAPHSSPASKEGLDALLTASAFGQNVTLLLIGDGIYQIMKDQDPSLLPTKNTAAIFQALDMYGIEKIVTLQSTLNDRNLTTADLAIECSIISNGKIADLYSAQQQILSF